MSAAINGLALGMVYGAGVLTPIVIAVIVCYTHDRIRQWRQARRISLPVTYDPAWRCTCGRPHRLPDCIAPRPVSSNERFKGILAEQARQQAEQVRIGQATLDAMREDAAGRA